VEEEAKEKDDNEPNNNENDGALIAKVENEAKEKDDKEPNDDNDGSKEKNVAKELEVKELEPTVTEIASTTIRANK